MAVYALLVGIDSYRGEVRPLRGAVRDVRGALDFLRLRVPAGELHARVLHDAAATRGAVIDGFRTHLSLAGPNDAAVFWFSGHGSQTPVPLRFSATEPTGYLQTLVCADSRHGEVPDLFDKEIGILISEVAARGAHVVAVLDCCHSDGATREAPPARLIEPEARALVARWTAPARSLPSADRLLPELFDLSRARPDSTGERSRDHVSLAACHSTEVAYEVPTDAGHRGLFSLMLLKHLAQPGLTYRELLARTRCLVETAAPSQHPVLHPVVGPLPERTFLGRRADPAARSAMTMRHRHGAWQVDAGACHGLVVGAPDDPTLLGLHDDPQHRQVRVVAVWPERCVVEPLGWHPVGTDGHYPVVVTRTPLPRAVVAIGGAARAGSAQMLADAVRRAGPGGAPSPYLELADVAGIADPRAVAEIRVAVPEPGVAVIQGSDGTPLDAPQRCVTPAEARRVVERAEHVVRWRGIRTLDNPCSRLAGAVAIDVVEALPGEDRDPMHRAPMLPDAEGVINLDYRRGPGGWVPPPGVFVRLRNTTDRFLYCVLLDLTDRFQLHPYLFTGGWIRPGTACVGSGGLISLALPPERAPVPGARGTDWFKVLVAESPIDSAVFVLPRLGEPENLRGAPPKAFGGVVERLGFSALYRDLRPAAVRALDWTTATVTITTTVPTR